MHVMFRLKSYCKSRQNRYTFSLVIDFYNNLFSHLRHGSPHTADAHFDSSNCSSFLRRRHQSFNVRGTSNAYCTLKLLLPALLMATVVQAEALSAVATRASFLAAVTNYAKVVTLML